MKILIIYNNFLKICIFSRTLTSARRSWDTVWTYQCVILARSYAEDPPTRWVDGRTTMPPAPYSLSPVEDGRKRTSPVQDPPTPVKDETITEPHFVISPMVVKEEITEPVLGNNLICDFQCCGSRMIYSGYGSSQEFSEIRILLSLFKHIWKLLKQRT